MMYPFNNNAGNAGNDDNDDFNDLFNVNDMFNIHRLFNVNDLFRFNIFRFNLIAIFGSLFNGLWYMIKKLFSLIVFIFAVLYSLFGYYIMWISLHYVAVHLYPNFCAPLTTMGFILSPFMVSAPHCVAMRWIIVEGSNVIVTMWFAVGAYAIQTMLRRPVPPPAPIHVPAQ
jgi:hypothetical protein